MFVNLDNYLQQLNLIVSISFFSSLASLFEFLNEEKSSLLKPVEHLKQTKTVERTNFIYAAIDLFLVIYKTYL